MRKIIKAFGAALLMVIAWGVIAGAMWWIAVFLLGTDVANTLRYGTIVLGIFVSILYFFKRIRD